MSFCERFNHYLPAQFKGYIILKLVVYLIIGVYKTDQSCGVKDLTRFFKTLSSIGRQEIVNDHKAGVNGSSRSLLAISFEKVNLVSLAFCYWDFTKN